MKSKPSQLIVRDRIAKLHNEHFCAKVRNRKLYSFANSANARVSVFPSGEIRKF